MTKAILVQYVLIFVAIIIFGYFLNFFGNIVYLKGLLILKRLMRRKLMLQFLKMTPTFYEKNRTGDLMARATNDLNAVSFTAGFGIMTLIDSTLYMGAHYTCDGFYDFMEINVFCDVASADYGMYNSISWKACA